MLRAANWTKRRMSAVPKMPMRGNKHGGMMETDSRTSTRQTKKKKGRLDRNTSVFEKRTKKTHTILIAEMGVQSCYVLSPVP